MLFAACYIACLHIDMSVKNAANKRRHSANTLRFALGIISRLIFRRVCIFLEKARENRGTGIHWKDKFRAHRTEIRSGVSPGERNRYLSTCTLNCLTCYIGVGFNEQIVLCESTTEEQSINGVSSFVHAFYNMTSTVLGRK